MKSQSPEKPPLNNGEQVDVTVPASSNSVRDDQYNTDNSIVKKNRVFSDEGLKVEEKGPEE